MTNKASVVPKEVRVQEILSRVNEVHNSFMWQVRYKLSTYWNRWQRGSEVERCSCNASKLLMEWLNLQGRRRIRRPLRRQTEGGGSGGAGHAGGGGRGRYGKEQQSVLQLTKPPKIRVRPVRH